MSLLRVSCGVSASFLPRLGSGSTATERPRDLLAPGEPLAAVRDGDLLILTFICRAKWSTATYQSID